MAVEKIYLTNYILIHRDMCCRQPIDRSAHIRNAHVESALLEMITVEIHLITSILVSFLATWVMTRKWIRKAPEIGLMGWDMNKPGRPKVAEMGGICTAFGLFQGLPICTDITGFHLRRPNSTLDRPMLSMCKYRGIP
jgi:hypothetical protein